MTTTYAKLLEYHRDLGKIQGTIFELLNRSKINDFHKKNFARIETIDKKVTELQKEYFVVENGKIKFSKQPIAQKFLDKLLFRKTVFTEQPIMQEGKTLKEYQEKFSALMQTEVIFEM